MGNTENMLDFKTVCECNRRLGTKTWHPQATIINLEEPGLEPGSVKFEFYAILLIESCPNGCVCCGRKYYDFTNATMVFLTPGEIFRMSENHTLPEKGWLLAFHPDLLFRTSLKNDIKNYTFFHYNKEEALHLSLRETATITCCLENIEEELHHPIDRHTSTILSHHIEVMLDYCSRYYERQFITRENRNKALLEQLVQEVDDFLLAGKVQGGRLPAPDGFAASLNLSVAYFNDLLAFELGKPFSIYIQFRQLELAKRLLVKGEGTAAEISVRLGFPSVQYFSFLFKKWTGVAPNDYRYSRN